MEFGKFLLGVGGAVGAIFLAPVVLPAAAAAGAAAAATGAAVAATAGAAVASTAVGSAAIGAAAAVTSAAAAAGTAVASTAAGTAAIGAMAAVGTGVGTAAGAVGLTTVATVATTSAGAAAVGTIATSAAVGATSAISGASKMRKASDLLDAASINQKEAKGKLDAAEKQVNTKLEKLGKCKVYIWGKLDEYIELFSSIRNVPEHDELKIDGKVCYDKLDLAEIRDVTLSVKEILGGGAVTLTGGQFAGLATSTGFTSIATASTGTAIAGLHGAAATNAAMAALGGGAIEAGGLGMAGGAAVANALAFAPALAIGGLFINGTGSKKLNNATDIMGKVDSYIHEVAMACNEMEKLGNLSNEMQKCLENIFPFFQELLNWLRELVDYSTDFRDYSADQKKKLFISVKIARILTSLTCTQLIDADSKKVETTNVEEAIRIKTSEFKQTTEA